MTEVVSPGLCTIIPGSVRCAEYDVGGLAEPRAMGKDGAVCDPSARTVESAEMRVKRWGRTGTGS